MRKPKKEAHVIALLNGALACLDDDRRGDSAEIDAALEHDLRACLTEALAALAEATSAPTPNKKRRVK